VTLLKFPPAVAVVALQLHTTALNLDSKKSNRGGFEMHTPRLSVLRA
jgi:hypothetical protein